MSIAVIFAIKARDVDQADGIVQAANMMFAPTAVLLPPLLLLLLTHTWNAKAAILFNGLAAHTDIWDILLIVTLAKSLIQLDLEDGTVFHANMMSVIIADLHLVLSQCLVDPCLVALCLKEESKCQWDSECLQFLLALVALWDSFKHSLNNTNLSLSNTKLSLWDTFKLNLSLLLSRLNSEWFSHKPKFLWEFHLFLLEDQQCQLKP
jgi:hypothetical protein